MYSCFRKVVLGIQSALFAARAWPEGLKVLLEARCDVNTTNHARRSPLHVAVLAGDLRTTQLLLDAKADVTIKDMDIDRDPRYISKNQQETPAEHRTALHHAAALGNPLLVKLLLQAGSGCSSKVWINPEQYSLHCTDYNELTQE
ncbi:unnamed protein product [Effrenium voratum]|nr:unnamed protein product [Effrenium voratum]